MYGLCTAYFFSKEAFSRRTHIKMSLHYKSDLGIVGDAGPMLEGAFHPGLYHEFLSLVGTIATKPH